ncbi:hypothetical protein [uncultured Clostridium sp.]|jgi:hypothetical protein|uniref:hypothetical protein n=1 Tax=uncultured Clostridium sp. TaxID=59620 RepID=UPI002628279C|nr:hypothetical protein [uncultured Clostridium sp.]
MIFTKTIIRKGYGEELEKCLEGKFVRRDSKEAIYNILEELFSDKSNCMESDEFAKFSLLRYELMQDMDIKYTLDIIDTNIDRIEHITKNIKQLYNNPYHLLVLLIDGVFEDVYEAFRKNNESILGPFDVELVQKVLNFICSYTDTTVDEIIEYIYDIKKNKDIEEEVKIVREHYKI